MEIKLALLEEITENFSEKLKVGSGGYGNVYRAVYNGQEIAVKKLHPLQGRNLRKVNHPNVVRLIGYCHESRGKYLPHNGELVFAKEMERALCFEYMQGGSLDKHIKDDSCDLDWPTCYKIIRGTCEGLNHLHSSQARPIFHLDLKPANIMLDKNLMAKIGDLGLFTLVASSETHKTEILKGTHGYMPPEYINGGFISKKFDVFSFGIIILKIIAGNKGYSRCYELPPKQFAELVINNWMEMLQSRSGHSSQEIDILRVKACVDIALRCVDAERNRRPSVKDIVFELGQLESKIKSISDSIGLDIDPALLRFLFEPRKDISCCLQLTNKTDGFIAFNLKTNDSNKYYTEPSRGIMPPCSRRYVFVTLRAQEEAPPNMQCHDILLVQSVNLSQELAPSSDEEITEDFFKKVRTEKVVAVVTLPIELVQSYPESLRQNYRMENMHMELNSLESILGGSESPRHLKLPFLQFITRNFSDELKIGSGGCGVVYKGILRNQIIAVKRLLNSHTIDDKMFHSEVKSLMMVNDKNIVRFLGYCSHTEEQALKMEGKLIMAQDRERLLCFEYLSNGSLESYLTDELRGLEWQTRYQIIKGICYGLHHLHCENHIVHMDLKPANILLDTNMVPKITDFGLSRLDNISRTMSSERLVSLGYCAPEYLHHGQMSAKSDIYSLGVIILELLTGSKEDPNITKVHRRWKHRWNKTARDAQLGYKQVAACLDLVGRCIRMDPMHRPNIWDIISYLNEMDSSDAKISDGTDCLELDAMLGVEPLEIHLPLEHNMQISRSVELTNDTDDHFAFRVSTTSLRPYCIQQNEGTVPPRSKCSVTVFLQAMDRALLWHRCRDEFYVQSTKVDGSLAATNIGGDIFNEEPGKVIDTVNFSVVLIEASSPSADR